MTKPAACLLTRPGTFLAGVLALAALACLTPVVTPTLVSPGALAGAQETPTNLVLDIADPEEQEQENTPVPLIPATGDTCAQVTAPKAVHLRTGATEHSPALDWLLVGKHVLVHLQEGAWSLVTTEDQKTGYVKSEFLEAIPCPP